MSDNARCFAAVALALLIAAALPLGTAARSPEPSPHPPRPSAPPTPPPKFPDDDGSKVLLDTGGEPDTPPPTGTSLDHAAACAPQTKFPRATAEEVLQGRLTVRPFAQAVIDPDLDGDIDWYADPFRHPSWTVYYISGRWIETLVDRALEGGPDAALYRSRAEAYLRDWLADVPLERRDAYTLICSARAFPGEAWIEDAIPGQVDRLASVWSGAWNHGMMEDRALLRIGCAYPADAWGGRPAGWRQTAHDRMASALEPNRLGPAIDEQGATNEQSTAYASFAHYLWARGAEQLAACGLDVPPKMTERTPRMPRFIGHSIQPNGRFVQLGDTYAEPPSTVPPGTEVEYAASLGSTGTPPASPVAIYAAGYVFGRSGWGTERPFAGESFYSLRFGPGRQVHGHNDHMSLTWYARGRELLVDSGHVGYEPSTYRAFLRSPEAHNVLTMPGVRFSASAPTTLTRSAVRATGAFYEMSDTAYAGRPRKRSVYVAHGPDIVVVFDRASGATRYEQLWHLDPQFDATVRSSAAATAVARGGNTRLWMFQVPFPSQTIPAGSTRVVKGRTSPYQGWVSRRMLHREAAPVVTMTRTGASTSMLTLIVPARLTAQVGYSFTRRQDGWYRLDVRIATSVSRFLVSPGGYIKPG